ncbi:hypothetical protein [Mitsuaria sp. BK037]|uniref:hypothetical protein n=1 Tax=Mitsuaria sp. BK037 TaxID=2587122 RepID=UPI00161894DF|nr:hypothetical protein [Mitsuaria sp. BK037]MBB3281895.1 hypothetical protein [Mitsuaria sp. BK037]
MHKFERPAEPPAFAGQTQAARAKVRAHFVPPAGSATAPAVPTPAARTSRKQKTAPQGPAAQGGAAGGRQKKEKDELFPGLWSKHKHQFSKAQLGKCGYCEGTVLGLQHGDVEHIRPKAEIRQLDDDPAKWGREALWSSSVSGRSSVGTTIKPGYWWLAYDWTNYLLSCQICNQQWKANFFPVDGTHPSGPPEPGAPASAKPLLLSPFDIGFNPADHFDYGRIGEIRYRTERGRATIATCGLDRPSLRLARYKLARATHEHLDEIARDVTERDVLRVLTYIAADGEDAQPFCGMVRTIFVRRTGLAWDQLGELIDRLRRNRMPDRPLCDC